MEDEGNSSEAKTKIRRGHQGMKLSHATLDKQVWIWYQSSTKNDQCLTKRDIQNYAQTIYLQANVQHFKASDGWYRRWRQRWLKSGSLIKTRMELQTADLDLIETFDLDLPDFDEHLFSLDRAVSLFDEFENIMKEPPKKPSPPKLHAGKRKQMLSKEKATVSKEAKICRRGKRYLPEFKERVIAFAVNHSFTASAAQYEVHPTTVSSWMKGAEKVPDRKQPIKTESTVQETDFAQWLELTRKNGRRISRNDVQEEVTKIKERSKSNGSKWFSEYYKRLFDGSTKNIQYPQAVKMEVVKLAESWSQKYVSSILGISRKQIYNWSKESLNQFSSSNKSALKDSTSKALWEWYVEKDLKPSKKELLQKASEIMLKNGFDVKLSQNWFSKWCSTYNVTSNSVLDKGLLEWILKKFDQNLTLSHQNIRKKCTLLHQNIYGKTNFKASEGWVNRFCKRYRHLLQEAPHANIVLPGKCEDSKLNFIGTVQSIVSDNGLTLDRIGIMDESALRFSVSDKKVKRLLRECSFKNIEGSFALSCTANGNMLPLLLVLKGTGAPTQTSDDIVVTYQQNGTVDTTIMKFWVNTVWMDRTPSSNVLILDCFQPHIESSVKEIFTQHHNHLAVIPAGCASYFLIVLSEVSVFISEQVNQRWLNWLKNDANNFWDDNSRSAGSPSHSEIISWIRAAFLDSKVKFQESIAKNFHQLLLTNQKKLICSS